MDFHPFKLAIEKQFNLMKAHPLYRLDVSKEDMWNTYLSSFPAGSNPVFRERTVHDCTCCKQFIRSVGNVVAYIDGKRVSIWDASVKTLNPAYTTVIYNMSCLMDKAPIREPLLHYETHVGVDHNNAEHEGKIETWEHFHVELPKLFVKPKKDIATLIGQRVTAKQTFTRALEEISTDAVNTVIELIQQNSLYRGQEHLPLLQLFQTTKIAFNGMQGTDSLDHWLWETSRTGPLHTIRNSSIGTLLVALSEGQELDKAVAAFEAMVAPSNYKRPTALITKGMIDKAQQAVEALGFSEALERRHATITDITVNNVIYADRNAITAMSGTNPFADLAAAVPFNMKQLSKVETIDAADFINNVVPTATKIEALVENQHSGNLMSLIAPVHPDSKNMLIWGNNFSWSYSGNVTDSMKERVKRAGGKVDGVIRFSIMWNDDDTHNASDYDAHCKEPGGHTIYFMNKRHAETTGNLDVDIMAPQKGVPAVENITWSNESKMQKGQYVFTVHGYNCREGNKGFSAELEYNGVVHSYAYNKPLKQSEHVRVAKVDFTPFKKFEILEELPSTTTSSKLWNVDTMQFNRVSVIMNSPNHWDGEESGNKHYFFILDGCKQPGEVRGFYNEFLTGELRDHRKVFEVLGNKMMVKESDSQLSGLGFSTTQRNHLYCRVTGTFSRILKVLF